MAYATPRTWVAGAVLTAAQLNQDVRDNVSFLANTPACRVYHNAAQGINNAALTAVAFNSERYDTNAMHDGGTPSRITLVTAGLYLVTAHVNWQANATGFRESLLRLNGGVFIAGQKPPSAGAVTQAVSLSTVYKFAAADYVELVVQQTSGGGLNINSDGNFSPEFSATWIGLG